MSGEEFLEFIVNNLDTALILGVLVYIGKKLHALSTIESCIEKIKVNVKVVADALIANENVNFDHTKLESYSPIKLTEDGEKFIKEIKFDKIFLDNKDDFYEFIASEEPKSEYDVQRSSIKAVIVLFDQDYFTPIKKHLYNNPKDKESIHTILGVYVREHYLGEHPELKIGE